jgi:hypothetical protein
MALRKAKKAAPRKKAAKRKVTKSRAKSAAKKAGKRYPGNERALPASWSKGGKEWTRVLGHFGLTSFS